MKIDMNMNKIIALSYTALCAVCALTPVSVSADPYPLEYFALRDVMSNVH